MYTSAVLVVVRDSAAVAGTGVAVLLVTGFIGASLFTGLVFVPYRISVHSLSVADLSVNIRDTQLYNSNIMIHLKSVVGAISAHIDQNRGKKIFYA